MHTMFLLPFQILGSLLGLIVYFIPTFIAFARHHQSRWAIFILDLLLGWSVIVWIICLVWSLTGVRRGRV